VPGASATGGACVPRLARGPGIAGSAGLRGDPEERADAAVPCRTRVHARRACGVRRGEVRGRACCGHGALRDSRAAVAHALRQGAAAGGATRRPLYELQEFPYETFHVTPIVGARGRPNFEKAGVAQWPFGRGVSSEDVRASQASGLFASTLQRPAVERPRSGPPPNAWSQGRWREGLCAEARTSWAEWPGAVPESQGFPDWLFRGGLIVWSARGAYVHGVDIGPLQRGANMTWARSLPRASELLRPRSSRPLSRFVSVGDDRRPVETRDALELGGDGRGCRKARTAWAERRPGS